MSNCKKTTCKDKIKSNQRQNQALSTENVRQSKKQRQQSSHQDHEGLNGKQVKYNIKIVKGRIRLKWAKENTENW